jgi:hypothetical protein
VSRLDACSTESIVQFEVDDLRAHYDARDNTEIYDQDDAWDEET